MSMKRTIIITGGNTGLGYSCAGYIAGSSNDYTIMIACRNVQKGNNAAEKLKEKTGNPNIYVLELNLASFASVRKFKEDYCKGGYPPLYGIVCNAGVHQHGRLRYTEDGIEEAFGVNHLGHFLLVNLLLQSMENDGRVVFVTSDTHDSDKIQFHDAGRLAYPEKFGCAEDGYPVSKLCNILCTYEMARRLKGRGKKHITVNAFNPGFMPDTGLPKALPPILNILIPALISVYAVCIGTYSNSRRSGKALAEMMVGKTYENKTGIYNDRGKIKESSRASYDKKAAVQLWVESAEMAGLKNEETICGIKS